MPSGNIEFANETIGSEGASLLLSSQYATQQEMSGADRNPKVPFRKASNRANVEDVACTSM
jgi:hypothetical protein